MVDERSDSSTTQAPGPAGPVAPLGGPEAPVLDAVSLDDLAMVLRRQERHLDHLLFKLVSTRHLLAAGETRYLEWSAAEVEKSLARVREVDLERATKVHALAAILGVPDGRVTLEYVIHHADEPHTSILGELRARLADLADEIHETTTANRSLAQRGLVRLQEVLEAVDAGTPAAPTTRLYTADRRTTVAGRPISRYQGTL